MVQYMSWATPFNPFNVCDCEKTIPVKANKERIKFADIIAILNQAQY